ncbi:MAG: hypothetical protein A2Z04_05780 [Chloroflexi bacterium RBG_16_57_9]|nr:MAG: hypothetical protein A2Z04_05780 [Chloroflexi bacterium RBG_16_57_9]
MQAVARADLKAKVDAAIRRIVQGYAPDKVIMYGSFARGDYHQYSDLDLLIIKETSDPFLRRMDAVLDQCSGDIAVEPLVYTQSELDEMLRRGNDFLEKALREGEVVYDKSKPHRS